MKLFGFDFGFRKNSKPEKNDVIRGQSDSKDMVLLADAAGRIQHSATVSFVFQEDNEQLQLYRNMANDSYVLDAVRDIINEAVDQDEITGKTITLDLRETNLTSSLKSTIEEEFENILSLMQFKKNAEDYFKDWLVDGRQFYYLIPNANPRLGLKEIRKLDPMYVKRIMKIEHDPTRTAEENIRNPKSVISYIYSRPSDEELYRSRFAPVNFYAQHIVSSSDNIFEIAQDAISYSDSGLQDYTGRCVSVLHAAIKPFNQLSMTEDATLIWLVARAPSRRVWYVGTGDLSPKVAAEYIQRLMVSYNNTDVYNAETGTVSTNYKIRNILEDIWLPRSSNEGKNTEVDTLDEGKSPTESMEICEWYKRKLYKSLCIPESRLNPDSVYQFGRSSEIVRDEVKFAKYINSLRKKFSEAILDILKKQLILRKILSEEEWEEVKRHAALNWHGVSYFREMKSFELWDAKMNLFDRINGLVGTYVSKEFVNESVLKLTVEQIKKEKKRIDKETKEGEVIPLGGDAVGNTSIEPEYKNGVTGGGESSSTSISDIADLDDKQLEAQPDETETDETDDPETDESELDEKEEDSSENEEPKEEETDKEEEREKSNG